MDRFIANIRYWDWKELVDFLLEDARWCSRWEEEDARRRSRWEEEDACLRSCWEENFRHLDALLAEERRQHAAAQTIFLWLRRRRLHVQLARQTSRCHHEITERLCHAEEALGVQRHKEEASVRATALAEVAVKPEPPALLSPSPRPTSSYLGTVLNTNGGGHSSSTSTSPTVAAPTLLSVIEGKPLRVRHCARPRCCTGRRNCPRAPNPSDEATPSHPSSTLGGLPMPTQIKLA